MSQVYQSLFARGNPTGKQNSTNFKKNKTKQNKKFIRTGQRAPQRREGFFLSPRIHTHVIVLSVGQLQLAWIPREARGRSDGSSSDRVQTRCPPCPEAPSGCSSSVSSAGPGWTGRAARAQRNLCSREEIPSWDFFFLLPSPSHKGFAEGLVLLKRTAG